MNNKKIITCIACPRGCEVTVADASSKKGGIGLEDVIIRGNRCDKGMDYILQEINCPLRTVTSTVRTTFTDFPRLPVRTAEDIPLADVFRCIEEINRVIVDRRLHPGDVILDTIAGHPVKLIATAEMGEAAQRSIWAEAE